MIHIKICILTGFRADKPGVEESVDVKMDQPCFCELL